MCDCSGAVIAAAAVDDDDGRFPQKVLINSQIRGIFACERLRIHKSMIRACFAFR